MQCQLFIILLLIFIIFSLKPERVFVILYAVTGVYFAGVMVRLMLTLTPIVVVCAAIAFSKTISGLFSRTQGVRAEFYLFF